MTKYWGVLLAGMALSVGVAFADDPKTMLKFVYHDTNPAFEPGSFAALTKTVYLWGAEKGRIEEQEDPQMHLKGLVVVCGKDLWMINLVNKTGNHSVDPSPTHNFYMTIWANQAHHSTELTNFSMGHELAYMKDHHVQPIHVSGGASQDDTDVYKTTIEGLKITFTVAAKTQIPQSVEVADGDKVLTHVIYDSYEELPVDPSLFAPPADVTIKERSGQ